MAVGGQLLPTNYFPPYQHKQLLCEYKQIRLLLQESVVKVFVWSWGVTCFLYLCRMRKWSCRILLTSSSTSKFSPWPCYPTPQCFLENWPTGETPARSFYSMDFILALTEILSYLTSQVAVRKSVQHQHRHKHLRVSGSQKSGECCAESAARHINRLDNHSPPVRAGGSMWRCFFSNRPSVCLSDITNEEQYRLRGGINQTFCVQPPPAARRSQVIQREVHSHQQPQCLLPPHRQVLSELTQRLVSIWISCSFSIFNLCKED